VRFQKSRRFIITAAGTAKIRAAINNNGPEVKKIKFTDGQRSFLENCYN
jgi:hypothetical protein